MKIRPQVEIPGAKQASSLTGQVEAGTQSHFDAALLQAAQSVWETEPDSYAAAPKVQQALTAALEQLNQKTPSQLQALSKNSQGLANLTANLAQADGLSAAQTSQLGRLLQMALPRLIAYKTNVQVPGSNASTAGTNGAQAPGQGKTSASVPTSFFSGLSVQSPLSRVAGFEGQTSFAQESAPDSVRQLSPQGPAGATAQSSASASLPSGEPASELFLSESGAIRVFSVAVGSGQETGAPASGAQGPSGAQTSASGSSAGTGQSGPANASTGSAGSQAGTGAARNQGPGGVPGANQNGTTDTGFPVLLDMDVQVSDSNAPLDIQPGSQVTLKGDGTWVLPEGAATAAPSKPQAPAAPQTTAQASAETGEQNQASVALATPAAAPVAVSVSPLDATSDASPDSAAPATPAVDGDSAFQQELQAAEQALGDGTQTPAQTQSPQGAGQGQASGNAQGQVSQQMLGQAPAFAPQIQPKLSAEGQGGSEVASGDTTGSAAATRQGTSFGSALAAIGQNLPQSSGQTPQDGLVQGLSQQVADAVDSAAGANPGRLVIQLNPAGLGSVQVDLSMVAGKLTAHLVTSQQDVRDVLARDLSGFKAGLESHGIIVNEVSVALRSGVGDQQGSREQASQNRGRALPNIEAPASAEFSGGLSAYTESAEGTQQGFSALA